MKKKAAEAASVPQAKPQRLPPGKVKDVRTIKDLTLDPENANDGTRTGASLLEDSLRTFGAGRSALVDRGGVVMAGNKTLEQWAQLANPEDIVVVKTDGKKLVLVQRTDLDHDSPEGRGLKLFDNRVGEKNLAWNTEKLLFLESEKTIGIERLFSVQDIAELRAEQRVAEQVEQGGNKEWDTLMVEPPPGAEDKLVQPDPVTVGPAKLCPTCGQPWADAPNDQPTQIPEKKNGKGKGKPS